MIYLFNVRPVPKPRMTRADRWSKRKCVLDYWTFKDNVLLEAKKNGFVLKDELHYKFVFEMPTSWPDAKKKKMINNRHKQRPDLDNLLKAFWDATSEHDEIIAKIQSAEKVWGKTSSILIWEDKK